jgi:hypothetical protein
MKAALACLFAAVAVAAMAALAGVSGVRAPAASSEIKPVWAEAKWPFPMDEWGVGRAFVCAQSDCGTTVELYVRPKIGYCNCATGVSDDAELERVGDLALLSKSGQALLDGRPVKVGWMAGRSRAYRTADGEIGATLLSVGFNDECDVVVATAKLASGDAGAIEPAVIGFLNSMPMVLWAKKELGLEYIKREW